MRTYSGKCVCALVQIIFLSVSVSAETPRQKSSPEDNAGIRMVAIPAGTFRMGTNWENDPRNRFKGKGVFSAEMPIHTVTLSAFSMSATEITQGQYTKVTGTNPSVCAGDENLPVETVSWRDAVRFCNILSDKAGLDRCYDEGAGSCDFEKNGYRLPTEAEWEYACRAGTETTYYSGESAVDLGRVAWYSVNSGERNLAAVKIDMAILEESHCRSHPVGLKEPNAWGLYDMIGNVYEWCYDWYSPYTSDAQTEPSGPREGKIHLIRGGGWGSYTSRCTSFGRSGYRPESKNCFTGFRVVRRVP